MAESSQPTPAPSPRIVGGLKRRHYAINHNLHMSTISKNPNIYQALLFKLLLVHAVSIVLKLFSLQHFSPAIKKIYRKWCIPTIAK